MDTPIADGPSLAVSPTPVLPTESVFSFPSLPLLGEFGEHDICGNCVWRKEWIEDAGRHITELRSLPWDQLQFRAPPDSPLGGRTPPQSMMQCPRRPIGPHPPRSMPLFKWIHSPEFETSTSSEEALVQGTSHVQCNPLTLPNTRS
ncbi:hypothetical protein M9H77_25073 [Catharanthus roseus]|uniref:Uncharacterized protein n=1 Tax=Catharanthus roseus TaxID=4058 RepID=A0ACC0A7A6_CATRO|nr:hypothetical protein M9H77_25073 [Catharanthus roseus]